MNYFLFLLISVFATCGTMSSVYSVNLKEEVAAVSSDKILKMELCRIKNHLEDCEAQFVLFTNDHADCRKEFQKFSKTILQSYCKGEGFIEKDIHDILDALAYAAQKHKDGLRKAINAPYIIHPLVVAEQLISIGHIHDKEIIIAGLLHDTVEKADVTFEELEALFGARITGFVREVTDDYSIPKMERRRLQVVNAPGKTAAAAQIDLSDKLYDITELAKQSPAPGDKRALRSVLWIKDVVDNLPWVNAPLKQACDKVIAPLIKQLNN